MFRSAAIQASAKPSHAMELRRREAAVMSAAMSVDARIAAHEALPVAGERDCARARSVDGLACFDDAFESGRDEVAGDDNAGRFGNAVDAHDFGGAGGLAGGRMRTGLVRSSLQGCDFGGTRTLSAR